MHRCFLLKMKNFNVFVSFSAILLSFVDNLALKVINVIIKNLSDGLEKENLGLVSNNVNHILDIL